jgi:hypothetical protein
LRQCLASGVAVYTPKTKITNSTRDGLPPIISIHPRYTLEHSTYIW